MAATVPGSLETLLADSALTNAHTGVYVCNTATKKALYSHQSDKYFVPASNTKLFSCYAGMKYLGDSLVGVSVKEFDDKMYISGTGDPTFLHPDFKEHPVFTFLKKQTKAIWASSAGWRENGLGSGWSWSDYSEYYMAERSGFPIYGNVVRFSGKKKRINFYPKTFISDTIFSATSKNGANGFVSEVQRDFKENKFVVNFDGRFEEQIEVPFITSNQIAFALLADTIHKSIVDPDIASPLENDWTPISYKIHSQPTDSLLKPMMHHSDNFFAEQTLLMVSNEKLGYMNDRAIIDTLLKTDLKDLPQKPVWVDGSGLSRYNLFTPQTFVKLLEKMKDEFGMERIKNILPTGGEGTLSSLYKSIPNQIFAKTGTLSGQVALSGYLFTKNNTLLIFSILVNNHNNTAGNVRRAVEKFVLDVWAKE